MKRTALLIIFSILMAVSGSNMAHAQCAMCAVNAEQSVKNGNTQGMGLNTGILYLLAIPYVLVTAVGIIWYKKYRKRNIQIDMPNERINLN